MTAIFKIVAEILNIFRLSKEEKRDEIKIKNQEIFTEREKKQQEVSSKDSDEQKIADVINAPESERQKRLEEIRKIISK